MGPFWGHPLPFAAKAVSKQPKECFEPVKPVGDIIVAAVICFVRSSQRLFLIALTGLLELDDLESR
jgi:hypothetical protein